MPREEARLVRFMASRYARAYREAEDLYRRLQGIEHEQRNWEEASSWPDQSGRAEKALAQIAHIRKGLERSARVSVERVRAIELFLASVVVEALQDEADPDAGTEPETPVPTPASRPAPEIPVRGGWHPPG